jgi:sulfatase modifying factor 1
MHMRVIFNIRVSGLLVLILLFTFSIDVWAQRSSKADRKDYKEWLRLAKTHVPENFVLFTGGTFLTKPGHDYIQIRIPQEDSATLQFMGSDNRRVFISPYALSKTEVTNNQYRAFVNWVVDSIALSIMAKSDPSFYSNTVTKQLDWRKRDFVRDSNSFGRLSPLYEFAPSKNHPKGGKYRLNVSQVIYQFSERLDKVSESLSIYPDTLVWIRDYPYYSFSEPMMKRYFSHPAFGTHPVVGVSWRQAMAYCDWLNRFSLFTYRLPSSAEFHNAYYFPYNSPAKPLKSGAKRGEELMYSFVSLPWNAWTLWDRRGKYLANFGKIKDEYNFQIKDFGSDGEVYTSKVGNYPQSTSGLYDLSGNVAEWVSDTLIPEYVLQPSLNPFRGKRYNEEIKPMDTVAYEPIILYSSDSMKVLIEKLYDNMDRGALSESQSRSFWREMGSPVDLPLVENLKTAPSDNSSGMIRSLRSVEKPSERPWYYNQIEFMIETAMDYQRNLRIIASKYMPRSVMGGSWQDGPLFLQAGVKQVYDAKTTSSKIGFRVAADVIRTPAFERFMDKRRSNGQHFPVRRPRISNEDK